MASRGESQQHKLDRVRPPRVQITYDVEIGDAIEKKELPFVAGVLADLSGMQENPLPPMSQRKFVEISRDNFDKVVAAIEPRLALKVANKLENDDTKMSIELKFRSMEDFEPERVVNQIEPLRKLLEARQKLADLKSKVVSNERLDTLLQQILANTESTRRLGQETGRGAATPVSETTSGEDGQ